MNEEALQEKLLHNMETDINQQMWKGTLPSVGLVCINRKESQGPYISMFTGAAALGKFQQLATIGRATLAVLDVPLHTEATVVKDNLETLEKRQEPPRVGFPVDGDGLELETDCIYNIDFEDKEGILVSIPEHTRYSARILLEGYGSWIVIESWRLHRHPDQSHRESQI